MTTIVNQRTASVRSAYQHASDQYASAIERA